VLATDRDEVVGMYSAAVLPAWVNGRRERVGYLGGLRVRPEHRRRIRHLREGFRSITRLAPERPSLPLWFTVVAAENATARRLLEAGSAGLPRYRPLGGCTTYALPRARARVAGMWRELEPGELPALIDWHGRLARQNHLAPVLDEAAVGRIGTRHFFVAGPPGRYLAMAALWDQRPFKQVVARRYGRGLHWALPAYNLYARAARRVPLPPEGTELEQVFIAFLAIDPDFRKNTAWVRTLLADLLARSPAPVVSLGLHDADPLREALATFRPMQYPVIVYAVELDGPTDLDTRPVVPDAALL
jgi:hypothetical protein